MKRKSNLYINMLSYDNACKMFKKVKKNCKNRIGLYEFSLNYNQNIIDILYMLYHGNYVFSKYKIFLISEPKYRIVMSQSIADKLVNHLVSNYILLPALEHSLIDSNVATRVNKGSDYAFNLFLKYTNRLIASKKEIYVLKIDISKYFYNIDHEMCISLLRNKIKEEKSIKIISDILKTTNEAYINKEIKYIVDKEIRRVKELKISDKEKSIKISDLKKIPHYYNGVGLPIGNMSSQILAVFYLNSVDHYIKEVLKFKNYIRYMDDLIILDTDKERLKSAFISIKKKIEDLQLNVNKKSNIYRLSNGVTFLGYTFKNASNKVIIRYNKKTSKKIIKKLKYLKNHDYEKYVHSKASYKGFLSRSNTSLYDKIMDI